MRIRLILGLTMALTLPTVGATQAVGSSSDTLQEIVVTAQRRSEDLQSVPIAVTVLAGSTLAAHAITDVQDLATVTPGLQIANVSGFVLPRIRGVGTTAYGAGLENSVATYVDGVYLASGPGADLTLDDIQRVEVLKGPQGTLFGRNATGGLINIVTRDPTDTATGELSVGYANYQTSTVHGHIGGGIGDTLSGDLAFRESGQGQGYGRNEFTGADVYRVSTDLALRSKWIWLPADLTSVRLILDYAHRAGSEASTSSEAPGTRSVFAPNTTSSPWDLDSNVNPMSHLDSGGASLKIDQSLGAVAIASITAYRRSSFDSQFDADAAPVPAAGIVFTEQEHQFSQELQILSSNPSRLQWIAGVYYFTSKGAYAPQTLELGPPLYAPPAQPFTATILESDQKTSAIAGYAQGTFALTSADRITVGGRFSNETKTLDGGTFGSLPTGTRIPLGPAVHQSKTFDQPTWRVAFDHQFAADLSAFISYNRGFKSGGFNASAPTQAAFNPESLNAYEVGLKSEWLDHRVRINVAGFYYDYKDIQVAKYVNNAINYYNASAAEIYGTDLDLTARVVKGLDLTSGISLLHDRFTDFSNALYAIQLATGGSKLVIQSATGNQLPLTPQATANLALNYRLDSRYGAWITNCGVYYNHGFFAAPDNILRQKAYTLLDASATWRSPGERYQVMFFGRNLSNRAVVTAINSSALSTLTHYQAPRTYGVELKARF